MGSQGQRGSWPRKKTTRLFLAGLTFLCLFLTLIPNWELIHIQKAQHCLSVELRAWGGAALLQMGLHSCPLLANMGSPLPPLFCIQSGPGVFPAQPKVMTSGPLW